MDIVIPGIDDISQQLQQVEQAKKPKMLVVDDEPDNLDLLYRTFRRHFNVLKAESGGAALDILAQEGEVAVIISDQRMPEMKGTEFLSKTVVQFPNTMRIILTGFTDVEDLVEAINSGQVYKYITKPWDPSELKTVVQRAVESYELQKQRSDDLKRAQAQTHLLSAIVRVTQRSVDHQARLDTIVEALCSSFSADRCILQMVRDAALTEVYSSNQPGAADWLQQDPLAQQAIAQQVIRGVIQVSQDPGLSQLDSYGQEGIQSHVVIPIIFQEAVMAVISLQWINLCPLRPEELQLLYLSAQQIGLAISCTCR
ncbi:MAG: response regulator [Synechococcales cyanobacterium K44_A2020_017]|jgi:CheY-like chemotaxis protein|nr:response regulator [Synechococcales cyanobacterium K32_A2020_035]MBF2094657.1 response regulator [Synechococcales cyanobacterium K44_A2020_017]